MSSSKLSKDDGPTRVGPLGYGGANGSANDIDSNSVPKALKSITIYSKDGSAGRINSISFVYLDNKNKEVTVGPWGTEVGAKDVITIDADEYLTVLSGTTEGERVTSLKLITSGGATYGPFGKLASTDLPFEIDVKSNSIVAFFGRSSNYLNSIGAYSATQA